MPIYVGKGNKTSQAERIYVGVNNVAREIGKVYAGVDNVARLISQRLQIELELQTRIAAGRKHGAFIESCGTAWAWGDNAHGQLGDGTTDPRDSKQRVRQLPAITSIVSGDSHTLALQPGGTIWSWGYNYSGQLGNGAYSVLANPSLIMIGQVRRVAANAALCLALKEDGTVWGWGYGGSGQLGGLENIRISTPIQIIDSTDISEISVGGQHCLALNSDGAVWAWGDNTYGQLGVPGPRTNSIPSQVPGLSGIIAISAGGYHNLALKDDGSVYAWGWNGEGQLDAGCAEKTVFAPARIANLANAICVGAGSHHSIALLADDRVLGWGHNDKGQLGAAVHIDYTVPAPIAELQDICAVAAGYNNTIAIDHSGNVHFLGEL